MNDFFSLSSNFSYSQTQILAILSKTIKLNLIDRYFMSERVNLRSRSLVNKIKNKRKLQISILILGNHASAQQRANFFNCLNLFQDAVLNRLGIELVTDKLMNRLGIELVTDERDLVRIRKLTTVFSEEDLAMELAKSHMHYIVCHPHQETDGLATGIPIYKYLQFFCKICKFL